jgi:hypothetical protein
MLNKSSCFYIFNLPTLYAYQVKLFALFRQNIQSILESMYCLNPLNFIFFLFIKYSFIISKILSLIQFPSVVIPFARVTVDNLRVAFLSSPLYAFSMNLD